MNPGHTTILSLLRQIRSVKPDPPAVQLSVCHWFPDRPDEPSGFVSRGLRKPQPSILNWDGPVTPPPAPQPAPAEPDAPPAHAPADGLLRIGEVIRFTGYSSRAGYVHLFNLGTSGRVGKLAPTATSRDNRIAAGGNFAVPSPQLLMAAGREAGFRVEGPTTARSGQPDRLLVIVTAEDILLDPPDLHLELGMTSRGAGFTGQARVAKARLFTLPADAWEYGLIEMEVLAG